MSKWSSSQPLTSPPFTSMLIGAICHSPAWQSSNTRSKTFLTTSNNVTHCPVNSITPHKPNLIKLGFLWWIYYNFNTTWHHWRARGATRHWIFVSLNLFANPGKCFHCWSLCSCEPSLAYFTIGVVSLSAGTLSDKIEPVNKQRH